MVAVRFFFSFESSFCNALSLSSTALLAERCGRVVTLAADVVVVQVMSVVYMAFIDDLSYQGSGSTEAMSAATRKSLSGPLQQSTAPGLSLLQQHSDPGMGEP